MSKSSLSQNILTIQEVAEIFNISTRTVHRMIKKGDLPYFKSGNTLRFHWEQIENYIKDQAIANQKREQAFKKLASKYTHGR